MRTIYCWFTVFLMTTIPTTLVIYSLKFVIVFKFWAFIFSHLVPVAENQPVLWTGL